MMCLWLSVLVRLSGTVNLCAPESFVLNHRKNYSAHAMCDDNTALIM